MLAPSRKKKEMRRRFTHHTRMSEIEKKRRTHAIGKKIGKPAYSRSERVLDSGDKFQLFSIISSSRWNFSIIFETQLYLDVTN